MDNSLGANNGSSLASREVSDFPVSIGTGLSLLALFPRQIPAYDPERKVPQKVDVSAYQECWISLSTIFRNMVNAMTPEAAKITSPMDYRDAIESEIDVINGLFMNEGNNLCKPMYYICSYSDLRKVIPKSVNLREDKTDIQKEYSKKHDDVMQLLTKTNDEIYSFDHEVKPKTRCNALILTHRPWDLLSHKHFNKLDLLESNTGKLKSKYLWNTKYYPVGDSDISSLPFNRRLLLIFGDRVQIQPSDIKLRRLIVETAEKCKWQPMTTDAKIVFDLQGYIREPMVMSFIMSL